MKNIFVGYTHIWIYAGVHERLQTISIYAYITYVIVLLYYPPGYIDVITM